MRAFDLRWLLPFGALITLLGYFGPWVDHKAAALVVSGLDLGEYVKFLVPIQTGRVVLWREGFYLPLFVVSLSLSFFAYRTESNFAWPVRILLLALAWMSCLNMLPPAWSPQRLLTPEFRLQTGAILFCLSASVISPFLALMPYWFVSALVVLMSLPAAIVPVRNFRRILPEIEHLYQQPITPGWGVYVMLLGLLTIVSFVLLTGFHQRRL